MPDQTIISKNLKLLKIDIWVHTILLILGITIPLGIFLWSFSVSDYIEPSMSNSLGSERFGTQIFSFAILFLIGIISITWQIISWSLHREFQKNHTQATQKVRQFIKFYYYILIISFVFPPFFLFLFLISPIFWLVYYVNLFGQRKDLRQKLVKISFLDKRSATQLESNNGK
jgi:hypothetical protein